MEKHTIRVDALDSGNFMATPLVEPFSLHRMQVSMDLATNAQKIMVDAFGDPEAEDFEGQKDHKVHRTLAPRPLQLVVTPSSLATLREVKGYIERALPRIVEEFG